MTTQQIMTQPWILRWQSNSSAQLRLAVDENLNRSTSIDRTYDWPCASIKCQSVSDQHAMRQGTVTPTDEHLAQASRYHDKSVISFVCNGNLLANYDFVAWQAVPLYRLANEPGDKQFYVRVSAS